jgi:hypothetical protein
MIGPGLLRLSGTTDAGEIAAVVAVVASALARDVPPTAYEKWRRGRVEALRAVPPRRTILS